METFKSKKLPFPKLYYAAIEYFYRVISFTASMPVAWNSQKKEFVPNRFYHIRFCFGGALVILTSILYDCSCVPVIIRGDPKEVDKMGFGIALAFVLHTVVIIYVSVLVVPPKRIVSVMNEIFNYSARINAAYRPTFNPEKSLILQILSHFGIFVCTVVVSGAVIVKSHYVLRPDDKIYPLSFLPPSFLNKYTYVLYGVCTLYLDISCWCMTGFLVFMVLTYCAVIVPLVYTELVAKKKNYQFSSRFRSINNLPGAYRSIEIFHLNVNQILHHCIIPMQASIGQNTLYCNFLLITRWNQIDSSTKIILVTWIGSLCGFWTGGLDFAGKFNTQTNHLLQSWNNWGWSKAHMKLMKRFKKSCRPLGVRAGPYYCIEKRSVLLYLRGIFEGTFRAFCITSEEITADVLMAA